MSDCASPGKEDPRHIDDILRTQLRSFYVWPEWAEGPILYCPERRDVRPHGIKLLSVGRAWAAGALQGQIAYRAHEECIRAEIKVLLKTGAFPPMTYLLPKPRRALIQTLDGTDVDVSGITHEDIVEAGRRGL